MEIRRSLLVRLVLEPPTFDDVRVGVLHFFDDALDGGCTKVRIGNVRPVAQGTVQKLNAFFHVVHTPSFCPSKVTSDCE